MASLSPGDRWLLVVDLDGDCLPFDQIRVRADELRRRPLPFANILVVENEKCVHQLPPMPATGAVLGGGFDVQWLAADWLTDRHIGYWGDLDTWGLSFLAKARRLQPELKAVLMDRLTFDRHQASAVVETTKAPLPPTDSPGWLPEDFELDNYLRSLAKGRLEQEFLDPKLVAVAVRRIADT